MSPNLAVRLSKSWCPRSPSRCFLRFVHRPRTPWAQHDSAPLPAGYHRPDTLALQRTIHTRYSAIRKSQLKQNAANICWYVVTFLIEIHENPSDNTATVLVVITTVAVSNESYPSAHRCVMIPNILSGVIPVIYMWTDRFLYQPEIKYDLQIFSAFFFGWKNLICQIA